MWTRLGPAGQLLRSADEGDLLATPGERGASGGPLPALPVFRSRPSPLGMFCDARCHSPAGRLLESAAPLTPFAAAIIQRKHNALVAARSHVVLGGPRRVRAPRRPAGAAQRLSRRG